MPNWCEGSMKLRGKPANILRFVKEGLDLYCGDDAHLVDKSVWLNVLEGEDYVQIDFLDKNIPPHESIHINGTRRAFIRSDEHNYIYFRTLPEVVIVPFAIKQAWGYDYGEFRKIAKTYEIDIRLYGIECGSGYVEDVEILDNGDTINDLSPVYENYNDYEWNCPFPWIGG